MSTDEDVTVANPYRAAIVGRRDDAQPHADEFTNELDAAVRAMDAGAWVSTAADTFYTELTGHVTTLTNAADGAMQEFNDAIENQPRQVEPNSWQTRWRNL